MVFDPKPWFKAPELRKEEVIKVKEHRKSCASGDKKFMSLLHEEKEWHLPSYENRVKRDKQAITKKKKAKKARTPVKKSKSVDSKK